MKKTHHGRKSRQVLTHAGLIQVSRIYFSCWKCQVRGYIVDDRLGVEGRYSHHAQRLICLAAASWSYDISSDRLEEFCGLKVCDTTIREVAQQHGALANEFLRTQPEAVREFRECNGQVEFTTDGTSVNTTEGWREMKLGIFSKRPLGESATPDEWDSRTLPAPQTRIAFAAIEKSEDFGRRWKAWARRLGLADTSCVTLLADGAKWIWEEQRQHLRDADGVLDIYHVLEHISATGKVLHPNTAHFEAWYDTARSSLLHAGWTGIERLLHQELETATSVGPASINSLLDYLAPHQDHLHYAERLAEGRSIGSGQIEGACKHLIGRRLKTNAARWKVRRVNRMAGLCCLAHTDQWSTYWKSP